MGDPWWRQTKPSGLAQRPAVRVGWLRHTALGLGQLETSCPGWSRGWRLSVRRSSFSSCFSLNGPLPAATTICLTQVRTWEKGTFNSLRGLTSKKSFFFSSQSCSDTEGWQEHFCCISVRHPKKSGLWRTPTSIPSPGWCTGAATC